MSVTVGYLQEVAHGGNSVIKYIHRGNKSVDPRGVTHCLRGEEYDEWVNSNDWTKLPDRWELLLRPDCIGRFDVFQVKGGELQLKFSANPQQSLLPIVYKRKEVEGF